MGRFGVLATVLFLVIIFCLNQLEPTGRVFPGKLDSGDCTSNYSKIYFLKTHKTASSVLENIMMRYAWFRNLTVARPSDGRINFSNYKHLQES